MWCAAATHRENDNIFATLLQLNRTRQAVSLRNIRANSNFMLKQTLRRQMRTLRAALSLLERASAAALVNQRLRALCLEQNWNAVAVYLATDEELNLDEFIAWLLARGVKVYAPYGDDFALLNSLEAVNVGKFGVREPRKPQNTQSTLLPEELVFLMPGLAFDRRGSRLGFGGGWYDRALSRYPQALKIGIAFDFQIVDEVPREAHDILMDALVAPSACHECKMQN